MHTATNEKIQDGLSNVNDQIDHPLNANNSDETNEPNLTQTIANGAARRHGMCLAPSDHDRIKTFISEFLQRGLVSYAERVIKILSEQAQSKKSILKSFNIPRKLFGGSSSSSGSSKSGLSTASSSLSPIVTVSAAGLSMSALTSNLSGAGSQSPQSSGLITITNNTIPHANDELQIRRLADLAFMFRLYELAYNSYQSCKKEFTSQISNSSSSSGGPNEQLLNLNFYLAGALEMASLSNFMQNCSGILGTFSTNTDTINSLTQSISSTSISSLTSSSSSATLKTNYNSQSIEDALTMLNNTIKNTYFSTRCALLSTEALKAVGMYARAATQFINLVNEESEIRSALFLEQAALCYLAIGQPQSMVRKYAFFLSLAGHRFNKAGQVAFLNSFF
jgi:trafficking protein particle complex subunit 8